MAGTSVYYCKTCNTDLGADGASVDTHLAANPTHIIDDVILDSTKTISTVQGITRVYNNELYTWDETRQKWLSVNRMTVLWGSPSSNQNNVYIRLWGSIIASNTNSGYILPYNATIVKAQADRTAGTGTMVSNVRPYGGADLYTYTLGAGVLYGNSNDVNTDLSSGVRLCCYLGSSANSSYPIFTMELAWRI
jgi:hypothetical protein